MIDVAVMQKIKHIGTGKALTIIYYPYDAFRLNTL